MTGKRKTSNADANGNKPSKRPKLGQESACHNTGNINHPVLQRFYFQVLSLRQYLVSKLPSPSKKRRRRISHLGFVQDPEAFDLAPGTRAVELCKLLDTTLIGVPEKNGSFHDKESDRLKDLEEFSQRLSGSTAGSGVSCGSFSQAEIVDFVIWRLFKKYPSSHKPPHQLCHGFQRAAPKGHQGLNLSAAPGIPGILSHYPNSNVEAIKGPLWCDVLSLLGRGGDCIMLDLLLECGIFYPIGGVGQNYYQLSGYPLPSMKPLQRGVHTGHSNAATLSSREPRKTEITGSLKATSVKIVRNRMLYAKAALNANQGVRFGLRHIHVFNRFSNLEDQNETVHIMKYIFPRQFGLHNVFTSTTHYRDTTHAFKDYTLREQEITYAMLRHRRKAGVLAIGDGKLKAPIPKRLRGKALELVSKLRRLNQDCSYTELLRYYCPIEGIELSTKDAVTNSAAQTCFMDLASPCSDVSAFCRAVISKMIPKEFWGDSITWRSNRDIVLRHVDQFIHMRKFESLTLHHVVQGIKISTIPWLRNPRQDLSSKMSKTDFAKCLEIFMEFVYYLFDSFLIPLIRSNFYVTESNVHRNRLFYFRHDVWRMLAEPSLTTLKSTMLEEMRTDLAVKALSIRPLGYSRIRLLPKATGTRPISNLRRRQQTRQNGKLVLGRSINSVMTPVFNVFNYEKSTHPDKLGSSLFSVGDIYPRLMQFKKSLAARGMSHPRLYFAKVDVQSCFDTIPQERLMKLARQLLTVEEYQIGRHAEVLPPGKLHCLESSKSLVGPVTKYIPHSVGAGQFFSFEQAMQQRFVGEKRHTVFVDSVVQQMESRENILDLLEEHVQLNLLKIGKKYYRQKNGIPQGSILSSLLCNFFYAELERNVLGFLHDEDSVLLRLLDDFLLITIRREKAERFLRVMHKGNPEYGVTMKLEKSLANFDTVVNGSGVPKPSSDSKFPYCGVLLDTRSLDISKVTERKGSSNIQDTLTIDLAKAPGQTFHRKTLNAFKIRMHAMFLDTSFNSVAVVMSNLYQSFLDAAERGYEYLKNMPASKRPVSRLLIKTLDNLISLAFVLMRNYSRRKQDCRGYQCAVTRRQVKWLGCQAFREVFQRKQTKHAAVLAWLDSSLASLRPQSRAEAGMMGKAVSGRA